ncbi:hypothetical protein [Thiobacillus sp.]|uniref:hypothetical protein n=1 Tax=Thiobacillus sp. TaxID=924 RepID=UPI00286D8FA9|nr:hypothetical protein [Thiobacillus sp.]
MTLHRILLAGLLLASLAACTPWARVDSASRVETRSSDYTVELPLGWVKATDSSNGTFITRDGPALNAIVLYRKPHDAKLPRTKRTTNANMLPHELAELALAEWRSTDATANLEVIANTPATLGGLPAVRLHIRYKNERGLPIERLMIAIVDAKGRLALQYEAPGIVYFQRSLPDFEAMAASVRLQ